MKIWATIKVDLEVRAMAQQIGQLLIRRGLRIVPPELVKHYEREFGPLGRISTNTIFGLGLLALRAALLENRGGLP